MDMQETESVAVRFENVKFKYDQNSRYALNNVSFSVKEGEFVALIGHNGSGKSTTARLINGLLEATSGKITVFGKDVSDKKNLFEVRKSAGIVFQNPDNQMVSSIVEDDVAFGPENIGVPREEIGERIEWALSVVGMTAYRNSSPARLSGGQKQRIAIAGVLAIKPKILILDEPTAMLDPKGRKEIMDVVLRLNKEEKMTVIMITHFMEEALLADRTVVLNRGKIVLEGEPQDIFKNSELLETYNLSLPGIGYICKQLQKNGMAIRDCLYPEELAEEIASLLQEES